MYPSVDDDDDEDGASNGLDTFSCHASSTSCPSLAEAFGPENDMSLEHSASRQSQRSVSLHALAADPFGTAHRPPQRRSHSMHALLQYREPVTFRSVVIRPPQNFDELSEQDGSLFNIDDDNESEVITFAGLDEEDDETETGLGSVQVLLEEVGQDVELSESSVDDGWDDLFDGTDSV